MQVQPWTWDNHPEFCMSGRHRLTQDNLYERTVRGKPALACRLCHMASELRYSERRAKRRGYNRKLCRNQLHKMTEENTLFLADGKTRCRACYITSRRKSNRESRERYQYIKCDVIGCVSSTKRLKRPRWFLCKKHKLRPTLDLIRLAVKDPDLAALVRYRVA